MFTLIKELAYACGYTSTQIAKWNHRNAVPLIHRLVIQEKAWHLGKVIQLDDMEGFK